MLHTDEEIRVDFGNGEVVLLDDETVWHEIQDYINNRFHWLASKPTRRSFKQSGTQNDSVVHEEPSNTPDEEPSNIPETVLDHSILVKLQDRKINYLLWVLGKSNGRLHNKEAYEGMVKIGYMDSSSNPTLNVVSKARKYPDLIRLDNGYFVLTEKGWEAVADISLKPESENREELAPEAEHDPVSDADQDKVSEGAILGASQELYAVDYLLRALVKMGGTAKHEDLIGPMLLDGWQTISDTDAKRRRIISAIASNHKKYVDAKTVKGQITILKSGYERLASSGKDQNSPALSLYGSEAELSL